MPRENCDAVAGMLSSWANTARAMPPAWKGAGISQPVQGMSGQHLARMLPGKGLYLDCDLKDVGITRKKIPHVYERSAYRRIRDFLVNEQGAITSAIGVRNAIRAGQGQNITSLRTTGFVGAANLWTDYFPCTDGNSGLTPTYVNAPGGATMNCQTQGAYNLDQLTPSGSNTSYLISCGINLGSAGGNNPGASNSMYMLIDLLCGVGNLLFSNITTTVNSAALTRYTNGNGVCVTFANIANPQASGQVSSMTYTNQAGTLGQTSQTFTWADQENHLLGQYYNPFGVGGNAFCPLVALASGDYGVQSVQTFTTQTDTTGNAACLIYYPLSWIASTAILDDYVEYDLTSQIHYFQPMPVGTDGFPGCLSFLGLNILNGNSGLQHLNATFRFVQG